MNILITGITGFLGRHFTNYLINNNISCSIIGTYHNENKMSYFKKMFPSIPIHKTNMDSNSFEDQIESIIQQYKISYIIHCAAIKHINICQNNPTLALRINTVACYILTNVSIRNNIINMIVVSTDKTNNLCNIYGVSKYLMEEYVLLKGFSVYKGVNFFWSDGSVLDIWYNQITNKQKMTLRNPNHVRCFNTINYVCETIFKNINEKNKIIIPQNAYEIKLSDLMDAFCEYFNYKNVEIINQLDYEEIETINNNINKTKPSNDEIIKLIDQHHKLP